MLETWRIFMVSAVCVAILAGFAGIQAVELGEHYESQQNRLLETNARLEKLRAIQAQYPDLEVYEMEVESQRKHVDALLPDKLETGALLPKLQQNALKARLEIRELMPGERGQQQGARALPLQIKVAGDYFGMLDFVKSLEKTAPFCRIIAMEMEQKDNELEAMLQVNVYSL